MSSPSRPPWKCSRCRLLRKATATHCSTCKMPWQSVIDHTYVHGARKEAAQPAVPAPYPIPWGAYPYGQSYSSGETGSGQRTKTPGRKSPRHKSPRGRGQGTSPRRWTVRALPTVLWHAGLSAVSSLFCPDAAHAPALCSSLGTCWTTWSSTCADAVNGSCSDDAYPPRRTGTSATTIGCGLLTEHACSHSSARCDRCCDVGTCLLHPETTSGSAFGCAAENSKHLQKTGGKSNEGSPSSGQTTRYRQVRIRAGFACQIPAHWHLEDLSGASCQELDRVWNHVCRSREGTPRTHCSCKGAVQGCQNFV